MWHLDELTFNTLSSIESGIGSNYVGCAEKNVWIISILMSIRRHNKTPLAKQTTSSEMCVCAIPSIGVKQYNFVAVETGEKQCLLVSLRIWYSIFGVRFKSIDSSILINRTYRNKNLFQYNVMTTNLLFFLLSFESFWSAHTKKEIAKFQCKHTKLMVTNCDPKAKSGTR